jgi:hypothetical protein
MPESRPKKLKVRFTKQQMVFLEQVRAEGIFGETMEEVLLALFREQMKTMVSQARS